MGRGSDYCLIRTAIYSQKEGILKISIYDYIFGVIISRRVRCLKNSSQTVGTRKSFEVCWFRDCACFMADDTQNLQCGERSHLRGHMWSKPRSQSDFLAQCFSPFHLCQSQKQRRSYLKEEQGVYRRKGPHSPPPDLG